MRPAVGGGEGPACVPPLGEEEVPHASRLREGSANGVPPLGKGMGAGGTHAPPHGAGGTHAPLPTTHAPPPTAQAGRPRRLISLIQAG